MATPDNNYPELNDTNTDRDKTMIEDLGQTRDIDDLAYDEENESYEIDVKSTDPEYDHPDPYVTSVKNGGDFNSDYDEANKEALDHYTEEASGVEEFGMHIDSGNIIELDPIDEELAQTPEDERDDLDEEGYPKNDTPDKSDAPPDDDVSLDDDYPKDDDELNDSDDEILK